MKTITTVITLFFFTFVVTAQNEKKQQQVNNTKETLKLQLATYSGNNNGVFYFKNTEDDSLITFSNINDEIILKNDFYNKETIGEIFKITSKTETLKVNSKEEKKQDVTTTVTAYQKVTILVNIEKSFNTKTERSLGLN